MIIEFNQMDKEEDNLSSNQENEANNELDTKTTNDEERNYWQKLVNKIYTIENHAISIDLFNSILSKIKVW